MALLLPAWLRWSCSRSASAPRSAPGAACRGCKRLGVRAPTSISPTTGRAHLAVQAVAIGPAHRQHVDAAHRVTVDRGLIESRQQPLGDDLFGTHQALGSAIAARAGRSRRSGRYEACCSSTDRPACLSPVQTRRAVPRSRPGPIARPPMANSRPVITRPNASHPQP